MMKAALYCLLTFGLSVCAVEESEKPVPANQPVAIRAGQVFFSLTPPQGWIIDPHPPNHPGLCALVHPAGTTWEDAVTKLYVVAEPDARFTQDTAVVVLHTVVDVAGREFVFRTDTKTLAKTPAWTPGSGEPSLPLGKACEIAFKAGKARFLKADSITIDSVELRPVLPTQDPALSGKWYYRFAFSIENSSGDALTTEFPAEVDVLMNGTVIHPRLNQ